MTTTAATDLLIARQPVHDRQLRVVAYELLVQRRDGSEVAEEADASATISELGLSLVMGRHAYIPVTRSFLLEGFATALPAERVVLKIGPEVHLDFAALATIRELAGAGYPILLDRFEGGGDSERLLDLATIVGLDLRRPDRQAVRLDLERLRPLGVQLLAQNVEDHETLEFAHDEGFELLQGYFFCRPSVVAERGVQVNKLNRIRLAAVLQSQTADFDEIQEVISRDVGLSYNLLRFINSAFFSLPRRVDSIRDTLVLLGVVNVRKWATLMALAESDDKPRELVVTGLVRARMCELLAGCLNHADTETAFTIGLFSVVDALTDTSMVELLRSLPLSQEVISALLNHDGPKGEILRAVIAFERGNFAELGPFPTTEAPLNDLYAESVRWAAGAAGSLD